MPYLANETAGEKAQVWITFFILCNNYVPISLYVSMELAKLGQKMLMESDLHMYHKETDTPMVARTSNLNEELGQIHYIFSDKTGTLTRNEMEFRKCYVANTSYGFGTTEIGRAAAARRKAEPDKTLTPAEAQAAMEIKEAEARADPQTAQFFRDKACSFDDVRIRDRIEQGHPDRPILVDFLKCLAVSHTVVPEGDKNDIDKLLYQAESPDEGALVTAAKVLGYMFCGKTATCHIVNFYGEEQEFEILNINKFNSTRKRMSVVTRQPDGSIELLCKGADNVMLERLVDDKVGNATLADMLIEYSNEGLRTLVIAKKVISEEEWAAWDQTHKAAATAMSGRDEALMAAAEEIEQDMVPLGITAIEDKLQEGVPKTISNLALANIKLWVLTGDKMETAENIGFACNLLTESMNRSYLDGETPEAVTKQLAEASSAMAQRSKKSNGADVEALLVDGKALLSIMAALDGGDSSPKAAKLMADFIALSSKCKAVIACRVSPDQKRQIVTMMRNHSGQKPPPMTLAIGDGALSLSLSLPPQSPLPRLHSFVRIVQKNCTHLRTLCTRTQTQQTYTARLGIWHMSFLASRRSGSEQGIGSVGVEVGEGTRTH